MPWRDPSVKRCVRCAEIRAEIAVKIYRVLEKQWVHGWVAVISASPKAVMMANMLMLVMLVGGWR